MKKQQCLGCYQQIEREMVGNYHPACSKKLFGTARPPVINFGPKDIEELALQSLSKHLGVTGVQPKLATQLNKKEDDPTHRLMIVDWKGTFILKPPTEKFPQISVVEDLTMHLAEKCGLNVARHGLVRLNNGELAYVTKRFDRHQKATKIAMEDFCQLSELLTEHKYHSSMEKAGKIILRYAANSGLDLSRFFDVTLFCFLTGNSDMHLKKFYLIKNDFNEMVLAPCYDLLSTKILFPQDLEEMALPINGKKNKLKKIDFIALGKSFKLADKVIEHSFQRILKHTAAMKAFIEQSFISKELQKEYADLIDVRSKILSELPS